MLEDERQGWWDLLRLLVFLFTCFPFAIIGRISLSFILNSENVFITLLRKLSPSIIRMKFVLFSLQPLGIND